NRQSILLTNESGTSVLGDFFVSPDDPFFLQTVLELGGFQPIDWMFTLIGFLQADDGTSRVEYRGCFERSPVCSLDCALDLCEAPVFPWVGQLTYGETVNDNNLLMFWVCPDMDPSGVCLSWSTVRVLADDFDLGTTEQSTIFLQSIPGDFLLGLQGVCGGDGDSTVRSMGVSVLTETPIANPFVDGIVTREDLGDGSARLRWTYGERTDFGLAWIGNTIVAAFPTGLPGEFGEIVVPGVQPNDVLFVQVFRYEGAQAFGSERIEAGASTQAGYFIRGLCAAATGSPDPQINDAIFLLGSLFLATGAPPCPIACDVNATGVLELTDAVVILQYLFLSGPAPAGWIDRMPTCEPLLPGVPGFELGCGTPHEICTEPGPVGG
ncbi:MAG TPA: hypothetical protein VK116_16225, partial [Planctomycetota bacterium]|nr:hypothetical protein [Planctomycetota bacterium]